MQITAIKLFTAIAFISGQILMSAARAQASGAETSTSASFPDGCPALGALQYVCFRPRAVPAQPAKAPACKASENSGRAEASICRDAPDAHGNAAIPAELLNQIFMQEANGSMMHTPRQAQQIALALVEALQGAWARLPAYPASSAKASRAPDAQSASIATHNAQMLAAAMVGNALTLNPCLDMDQRRAAPVAGENSVGTTSSVCDPAIQAVNGIGVAKLNMGFYQKKAGASGYYEFPYYLDFFNGLSSWTGNQYRAGSFYDSVLYLSAFFTGLHSAQPLYFLKMPLNIIESPFLRASPFSKALPTTSVALDDSNIDYAIDAFAAFQATGVGNCLSAASPAPDGTRDPCSHQCRVNAANRVLGWVHQMQANAAPCVEPARTRDGIAPVPGMML
jgi:hypothetical protein